MSSGLGQVAHLARLRPSVTTAVALFTATAPLEISSLFICNTSGSAQSFRLFHTFAGDTTYDETTALYWDRAITADDTLMFRPESIGAGIGMETGDILAVQASAINSLTFTLYGVPAAVAPIRGF